MVRWVTKYLGIKDADSELSLDEYGSVIVDLRDVADGENDQRTMMLAFNRVLSIVAQMKKLNTRAILQCEGGLSRSPLFAAAIFVFANDLEWEDALDFIKKKIPEAQISQDLLDSMKKAFGQVG